MEQRLKVLKVMSEITGHTDMNHFAQRVGLSPTETVEQVQELAKVGFVKKVGSGYAITEKGKNALKAEAPVPEEKRFLFYRGIDQPTDISAASLKEFYDAVQKVDAAALEFHLYRGDFENWIHSVIEDKVFADELAAMRKIELKGEELRKAIAKAAETRFSIEPAEQSP